MIFTLSKHENKKVSEMYEKAMDELNDFFEVNWKRNTPNIILLKDRAQINYAFGRETQDWVVGWADGNNVFLLTPENYSNESKHKYSDDEYYKLIKHELSHLFYKILNKNEFPKWLNEGVSSYVSGQADGFKKPEKYTKFLNYYKSWDGAGYLESGNFVKSITEKYGKDKLLEFIKRTSNSSEVDDVHSIFKSIYNFKLSYEDINKNILV